jgi:hypothetical protein
MSVILYENDDVVLVVSIFDTFILPFINGHSIDGLLAPRHV